MIKINTNEIFPKSLRVCLTHKCNYNCRFCHREGELEMNKKGEIDADIFIFFLKSILNEGIENISFTGGDPFLYTNLDKIINESKNMGVKKISITTNGSLLNKCESLIHLPIDELHISLNTLDKDKYCYLNRKNDRNIFFENVIKFLNDEKFLNSIKFKIIINSILIKSINIIELNNLIDFANERNFLIIFWEVLKCNSFSIKNYFEISNIFDSFQQDIISNKPYRWFYIYTLKDGRKFAVAKCLCSNFCVEKPSQSCIDFNGIHITPDFNIKKCMFSSNHINLNDLIKRDNTIDINKLKHYILS